MAKEREKKRERDTYKSRKLNLEDMEKNLEVEIACLESLA